MYVIAFHLNVFYWGILFFLWDLSVGYVSGLPLDFDQSFLADIREWKLETDENRRIRNSTLTKQEYYKDKIFWLEGTEIEMIAGIQNYLNFRIDLLTFLKSPRASWAYINEDVDPQKAFAALKLLPSVEIICIRRTILEAEAVRSFLTNVVRKQNFRWTWSGRPSQIEFWDCSLHKDDVQRILLEIDPNQEYFRLWSYPGGTHFVLRDVEKK